MSMSGAGGRGTSGVPNATIQRGLAGTPAASVSAARLGGRGARLFVSRSVQEEEFEVSL